MLVQVTLLSALLVSAPPAFVPSEASLVEAAATMCKNAKKPVNRALLRRLVKLETSHGVPSYARGIVLAAACRESGYRAKPRRGDNGKAVGILQMWKWWEAVYGIDRENPMQSARAWLTHIGKSVKKAKRKCAAPWRRWLVAQAWIGSGPRGYKCRYSRHYRLLRYWRWRIKTDKSRK
tara:strand:+ start:2339 stop:2872 length:534 start_codon:yes stop_codon:yes gene_type:complete